MEEIWKDVIEYEGYYQVSNLGRVRSLDREIKHPTGKINMRYGHVMKLRINKSGYYHNHAWKTGLIKGKLTKEQVLEIRKKYKKFSRTNGMPALAKEYGVHDSCICRIINRKAYRNI